MKEIMIKLTEEQFAWLIMCLGGAYADYTIKEDKTLAQAVYSLAKEIILTAERTQNATTETRDRPGLP